jgi:PRTRC genetic system protein B
MNINYESNSTPALLERAVLFYRTNQEYFATLHDVIGGVIHPGKALDTADVEYLFHSDGKRAGSGYLDSNILELSGNAITWHIKSKVAPIFFNVALGTGQRMNKISGKDVRWPALLFRLTRKNFQCWALASNRRPTLSTPLYHAPLWNTSETGNVCMPASIRENLWHDGYNQLSLTQAKQIEEAFYLSAFSHRNGQHTIVHHRGGHDAFWIASAKAIPAEFPATVLVKTEQKLKDIIE